MHAKITRLIDLAEQLGVENEQLDDAVHELAQEVELGTLNNLEDADEQERHIQEQEHTAATINNGGLESQIEFLLRHNGPVEVEQILRQSASPGRTVS